MDVPKVQAIEQATALAPTPIPPEQVAENRQVIHAVKSVNQSELLGESELMFQLDRRRGSYFPGTRRSTYLSQ